MTSNIQNYLSIVLALFSAQALANVIVFPSTGINLNASPDFLAEVPLKFKPDLAQTTPVQYRLATFRVNGQDVDKSKLKVESLYTSKPESLDRYRVVLSGKERANPVTSIFKFKPTWLDMPGTYTGFLTSDSNTPDIPIKIFLNPKTTLSLDPANINITTSTLDLPIVSEVDIVFGSNSPRWELYLSSENLIKHTGDRISNDRVFVRIKDDSKPRSWLALNKPTMLISGYATSPTKIATLEFIVYSNKLEKAGNYLGKIKFLVKNI